jgi:hypothetical protein
MKEAVALSLLLLCWPSRPQSVTTVNIFAIEPCQMNFTINPSSGAQEMTSCVYSLPGADLTASDWPTCYLWCCRPAPACQQHLRRPSVLHLHLLPTAFRTLASTKLVTLIGILLGLLLLFVFVCIPCCCR